MRNSIEHSFAKSLVVFGQYWRGQNRAEIVIYDDGCGIAATIQNTHSGMVGGAALEKSLEAGVSGVTEFEMKHQHPEYRNSGFGLFVTSEISAQHGSFRLLSKDAGIVRSGSASILLQEGFEGTCIQVDLSLENFTTEKILQVVEKGNDILKSRGSKGTPSSKSKSFSDW